MTEFTRRTFLGGLATVPFIGRLLKLDEPTLTFTKYQQHERLEHLSGKIVTCNPIQHFIHTIRVSGLEKKIIVDVFNLWRIPDEQLKPAIDFCMMITSDKISPSIFVRGGKLQISVRNI